MGPTRKVPNVKEFGGRESASQKPFISAEMRVEVEEVRAGGGEVRVR
jgi:hypothetical protein